MTNPMPMIERVARAIHHGEIQHFIPGAFGFDALDAGRQEQLREMARAAIEAMREPSDLMMEHYMHAFVSEKRFDGRKVYGAMIDAALSEEGE